MHLGEQSVTRRYRTLTNVSPELRERFFNKYEWYDSCQEEFDENLCGKICKIRYGWINRIRLSRMGAPDTDTSVDVKPSRATMTAVKKLNERGWSASTFRNPAEVAKNRHQLRVEFRYPWGEPGIVYFRSSFMG